MSRIEITIPAGEPRMLVKTLCVDGRDSGKPWRFISGGESEPFDVEAGEVLTVEIHPEKEG